MMCRYASTIGVKELREMTRDILKTITIRISKIEIEEEKEDTFDICF